MHLDIDDPPSSFHLYSFLHIFLSVLESSLGIDEIPRHHVLILQSHGLRKISFHVVIRIIVDDIEFIWKNNRHCGEFVKFFLNMIYLRVHQNIQHPHLNNFCLKDLDIIVDQFKKSFLDSAIYTRNRCFRLYLSSKFGSNRHLQLMMPNTYCVSNPSSVLRHSFVTLPLKFCIKHIEHHFSEGSLNEKSVQNINYFVGNHKLKPDTSLLIEFNQYCTNGAAIDIVKIRPPYLIVRTNDHYCPYVQRCHRQNFIYFLVNIATHYMFFRCYDVECPQTNSKYCKLDASVINVLKNYVDK